MFYRTTTTDFGDTVTHDTGGYYENVVDGTPQLVSIGDYCGFQQSDTPEICASLTPEASLFAAAHNGTAGQYHIYRTPTEPDVDISTAPFDFSIINEVRYQHPEHEPVAFTHYDTITVPERLITDIGLSYLPPGPSIIRPWAIQVRDMIRATLLATDSEPYPENITERIDVPRPNPEAYGNLRARTPKN